MSDIQKTANLLSAADLFRGGDGTVIRVEIPEIKKGGAAGALFIRPLSTTEVMEFTVAQKGTDETAKRHSLYRMVASSLVTESGDPLIPVEDADKLGGMPINAFNAVVAKINEVSGIEVDKKGSAVAASETEAGKG